MKTLLLICVSMLTVFTQSQVQTEKAGDEKHENLSSVDEIRAKKKDYNLILNELYRNPLKSSVPISKFNEIWDFKVDGSFYFRKIIRRMHLQAIVDVELQEGNGSQVWLVRYLKNISTEKPARYRQEDHFSFFIQAYHKYCEKNKSDETFLKKWLLLERYLVSNADGSGLYENIDIEQAASQLGNEFEEELAFFEELEPFHSNSLAVFRDLYKQASEGVSFCDLKVLDPRKPSE